jgi:hypothetical protein
MDRVTNTRVVTIWPNRALGRIRAPDRIRAPNRPLGRPRP